VSLARRLSWTGGACLTHVVLGLAAAAVFWFVVDVTPLSALAYAFARLAPAPALALVATPLVLAPFRGRVLSPRPPARSSRHGRSSAVAPLPVPTPPSSLDNPFARPAGRRDSVGEPPPTAAPAPPVSPAPSTRVASPTRDDADDVADDAVVRVRFGRVAAQLPQDAFTLPLDRLSESLREPHWLTVPRRVVLALLPEGAVQIDWAIVASQFPALAFAGSDVESRQKYPALKIPLPLEDVLPQLPPGTFSMPPRRATLPDWRHFRRRFSRLPRRVRLRRQPPPHPKRRRQK